MQNILTFSKNVKKMSLSPMEVTEVKWQPVFVICIKTVFVNTYTYLKLCTSCFIMYKSLMNWKCFKYLIYISVTVRYKYVKYSVPVGHIIISPYCWHSNQTNYSRSKLVHGRIMQRRLPWKPYIYFSLII